MVRHARALFVCVMASFFAGPTMNVACAEGPGDQTEARALFDEGIASAKADRWAEALNAFQRSNALVARPSTSYNIANALYRLDRPVDALAELDKHDRMQATLVSETAQARSVELRTLVREAVAEVVLTVTPSSATVFVDGWPSSISGGERVLLLNPGNHFVQISRDGYHPQRRELRLARGDRTSLAIELQAIQTAAATAPDSEPAMAVTSAAETAGASDDRKPFVKRPGFWVLIGVIGAAAIGAGVAVAVTRRDDSPACGTTGDCATTQGLAVAF